MMYEVEGLWLRAGYLSYHDDLISGDDVGVSSKISKREYFFVCWSWFFEVSRFDIFEVQNPDFFRRAN